MVRAIAITDRGVEKVLAMEVSEIAGASCEEQDSCVTFDAKDYDTLFRLCYLSQASDRVGALFGSFEFEGLDDFLGKARETVTKAGLKEWLSEGCGFKVFCDRRGIHDFNSIIIEQEMGGIILEKSKEELGFEPRVELKQPDIIFLAFVNQDRAYLGVDFCGRDLSKRNYRIFTAPGIVNAKVAYSMARIAGYEKKLKMVDLYSKAGIVAIESALWKSGISVNYYSKDFAFRKIPAFSDRDWDAYFKAIDSRKKAEPLSITGFDPILRNLEAAKKNAKLAGVDKLVRFSKLDLEWADVKLDHSTVDLVVSRIPSVSHRVSENALRKVYSELFYQAEFFLKSGGKLCVLAESLALFREGITQDFRTVSEELLWAGGLQYEYLILERLPRKKKA